MERSDERLIIDYLAGDEKSLEILIRRYLKPIYSFAHRFTRNSQDAEDITQDTFVKMWRHLKRFNRKKSFKTWIFTIAKNTSIDFLKKKKTIPFSEFENETGENKLIETLTDQKPLADKVFERVSIVQSLQLAIDKLLLKYRLVLSLRYNDNLNFREIAETIGEPFHTVKSRHRRALNMLRKNLKEF